MSPHPSESSPPEFGVQGNAVESCQRRAAEFAKQYESIAFEDLYADVLGVLHSVPSVVLDVGAGAGRDAAWLSARGLDVVTVELAPRLQEKAAVEQGRQHPVVGRPLARARSRPSVPCSTSFRRPPSGCTYPQPTDARFSQAGYPDKDQR